jgi:peroxiredoxin
MRRLFAAVFLAAALAAAPAAAPAGAQNLPTLGSVVDPVSLQVLRFAPPFRPAPTAFSMQDVLGKKAVLFMYWMPGFPGSVNELVELDKFARTLKSDKLVILTASRARDTGEIEQIKDVIANKGITLPVLLDDMSLMMRLGVTNVPTYVGVGADRRIAITEITSLAHKLQTGQKLKDVLAAAAKSGTLPAAKGPGQNAIYQLVGDPAPAFALPDLNNKTVKLAELVGTRPTAVVFWSALCPHCQRELPRLQAYLKANPGKLNIVSVTRFGNDEHKQATYRFVKEKNITFPVLVDDQGVNEAYGVNGIPTWVLVDTLGNVSYAAVGEKEDLNAVLDAEIAKANKPAAAGAKKKK